MTIISAAEANRHFSQVLRQVAQGETLIITSRGKPMATIAPITRQAGRSLAQRQLLERLEEAQASGLNKQPILEELEQALRLIRRSQKRKKLGSFTNGKAVFFYSSTIFPAPYLSYNQSKGFKK